MRYKPPHNQYVLVSIVEGIYNPSTVAPERKIGVPEPGLSLWAAWAHGPQRHSTILGAPSKIDRVGQNPHALLAEALLLALGRWPGRPLESVEFPALSTRQHGKWRPCIEC